MLIYRAYIPRRSQDGVEQCYIGKTVQSLKERYNQHRRSANISKEEEKGKAGKLHKTMWAEGEKVHFEKIYDAKDAHDLAKKKYVNLPCCQWVPYMPSTRRSQAYIN